MRKLLGFLALLLASPGFAAVTFVNFEIFTGQIPVTTASYTPTAAGHQIMLIAPSDGGTALSLILTGSASTPTVFPVSTLNNFTDGVSSTYALWGNLSAASGAQTWTVTQPSGDFVTAAGYVLE